MSAGGLSYSGLVNYGATTLPSVESWGTNMNILRDPPKSIKTRKIDKVGETSSITEMIDASGDRAAEAILVYPRGLNPMVGVSYSNYGNNGGGGQAGSLTGLSQSFTTLSTANTQSFLPYRTAVDGAYRPPIKSQAELLPLSRLPRVWTSQSTTPGFADFTKKIRDCGDASNTREVKTETIKTFIRPTEFQRVEKPIEEPNEVKYSIQKAMNLQGHSGTRTMDLTEQYVGIPNQGLVQQDPLLINNVVPNVGNNRNFINNNGELNSVKYIQDSNVHSVGSNTSGTNQINIEDVIDLNTNNYIQDTNTHNVNSNTSGTNQINIEDVIDLNTNNYIQDTNTHNVNSNVSGVNHTNIEDIMDIDTSKYIQGVHIIDHTAPYSAPGDGTKYIHDNLQRDRVLPNHNATTNIGDSRIYKQNLHTNQVLLDQNKPNGEFQYGGFVQRVDDSQKAKAHLNAKISPGGYLGNNSSSKPSDNRITNIPTLQDNGKTKLFRFMNSEQYGRQ
jgi:hypothetical protein